MQDSIRVYRLSKRPRQPQRSPSMDLDPGICHGTDREMHEDDLWRDFGQQQ